MKPARYAFLAGLAVALVFAPAGCKRKASSGQMPSVVRMGDPNAEGQLSGFYGIEASAWRWTKQNFSVVLAPPAGAAEKGAWLRVKVTAPDGLIAKLGAVTLAASVAGQPLGAETYSAAGAYTYEREVASQFLQGKYAKVDFALDKAMPPAGGDVRELGIVVVSAGLEPK
jgi:hypothetical protein